ncbi:Glycosyl transferase CAP10 domain [Dillenia turbinata]|uniref:Glycosyl transferase CAP10 domain n=1 Tax=Dillenia turbinata TaxID=194707 RepID=A0AAN8UMN0_9MAGN
MGDKDGSRACTNFLEAIGQPVKKGASATAGASIRKAIFSSKGLKRPPQQLEFPLNCTSGNVNQTCPRNYPKTFETYDSSKEECPDYFKWIYEDLRPWQKTGITRDMVERAKDAAHIRIIVVDGKLLRLYPGKLPDLDIMFECGDRPVIVASDHQGANATSPPALPEINIKPWEALRKDLEEGSNKTKWIDREPYAFWRGNIRMGNRVELERCNPTDKQDWNARIFNLGYGKLLKYKPTVPPGAVEVCSETIACDSQGLEKIFKTDTVVKRPAVTSPCTMARPFDPLELEAFQRRKEDLMKQVEMWEANGVVGEDINLWKILGKA